MKYLFAILILITSIFPVSAKQLWPSVPVPLYTSPDVNLTPFGYITNRTRSFIIGVCITNGASTNNLRSFDVNSTNQFYWICLTNTSIDYPWASAWVRNKCLEIIP